MSPARRRPSHSVDFSSRKVSHCTILRIEQHAFYGGLMDSAIAVLHHDIIFIAIGALILIMGLVHGTRALTAHTQKGQPR
jgi:hypothetical protein